MAANDSPSRWSELSVAQRALLEERLRGHKEGAGAESSIPRCEGRGRAPLSFAQQRIWFFEQLEPGSGVYQRPAHLRLTGPLNTDALRQTLNTIVERHEVLRAAFGSDEGRPFQFVRQSQSLIALPLINLQDLPSQAREEEARRLAREEAARPFDLARGPVLRATLLRLSESEHVLLLVFHHIVFDGWSQGVLLREFTTLYEAFAAGSSPTLQDLPIQYADFAAWQREQLAGEEAARQLAYWRRKLADAPPALELPTARARVNERTYRGAEHALLLPNALADELKALGRREGATPFMTLLAALQTLLGRYAGRDDVIVGTPVAGRTRAETENLIGCFINTLALRSDLSGAPSFRELLRRVRATALEAYANQDLPFEQVVGELRPGREAGRTPFFRVMLNFRNLPRPGARSGALRVEIFEAGATAALEDLTLDVTDTHEGLRCLFQYSTDVFDAASIERLSGHFTTLLEGVAADPERSIKRLPLLTANERRQVLVEWNRTAVDFPRRACLHQLFEAQAERAPDAPAIVYEGARVTYGELNRRANALARRLQSLGVGPETLVGLRVEPSVELLVGTLGVLKAGGACVPVDPAQPARRAAFILRDARVSVLLTQKKLKDLPADDAHVVCLDAEDETLNQECEENPSSGVCEDNLAYAIYTSGSTGAPKGVMVAHRGVCNHLLWEQANYPTSARDRVLQAASIGFDTSVWEIFTALANGACLVVARAGAYHDAPYLVRLIREQKVSLIGLAPSVLQALLDEDESGGMNCLRRVFIGGEALTPGLQKQFFARLNAEMQNGYGPTECSIDTTAWECQRERETETVPIGRPVANARVYILDALLEPVPVLAAGELYVGGAGLARGYLNRPALTAERFIPDPFGGEPGARLYATGDRARYLPGGEIEFLGRADDQLKVRGVRVEPGEVEAALRHHPRVREAAVLSFTDARGESRLVAYLVGRAHVESASLRAFLRERLPECMLPSSFVWLDSLPLTPSGKLDKAALPAPDETRACAGRPPLAPRNATEETIARVWAEVLGREQVGVNENFFELGGHSLLAAQVVSRLRKAFRVDLPLRSLFQSPDIASLAELLARSEGDAARPSRPTITPLPRERAADVSNAEQNQDAISKP